MEVEEYSWTAGPGAGTRYDGINGQEEDEEIFKGSYSAEYWNYDSRVARRWNMDPRPVTGISDYACFGNNPIMFTDVKGDSLNFSKALQGTEEFKTAMEQWEKYSGLNLSIDENGDKKIQALDYAYNIQGWLKSVNSNSLNEKHDLGKDGLTSDNEQGSYETGIPNIHKNIAPDVMGFSLSYFNGDYAPINTNIVIK